MCRAWQRSIALLVGVAGLGWSGGAAAFHPGSDFDKSPGAGGGGGIFYTGVPRERGWTCAACHVDAPGTIRLGFTGSLVTDGRYTPGRAYPITIELLGEHAGLGSPKANYNTMAIAPVDRAGNFAGGFSGYAPEDFYDGGAALISAGKKVGVTSWTFTWTAPAAASGTVTLYLCIVDGNGANSPVGVTLTDPFGDDVVCGSLPLAESGLALGEPNSTRPSTYGVRPHEPSLLVARDGALGLLGDERRSVRRQGPVAAARRRRGRSRQPCTGTDGDAAASGEQ